MMTTSATDVKSSAPIATSPNLLISPLPLQTQKLKFDSMIEIIRMNRLIHLQTFSLTNKHGIQQFHETLKPLIHKVCDENIQDALVEWFATIVRPQFVRIYELKQMSQSVFTIKTFQRWCAHWKERYEVIDCESLSEAVERLFTPVTVTPIASLSESTTRSSPIIPPMYEIDNQMNRVPVTPYVNPSNTVYSNLTNSREISDSLRNYTTTSTVTTTSSTGTVTYINTSTSISSSTFTFPQSELKNYNPSATEMLHSMYLQGSEQAKNFLDNLNLNPVSTSSKAIATQDGSLSESKQSLTFNPVSTSARTLPTSGDLLSQRQQPLVTHDIKNLLVDHRFGTFLTRQQYKTMVTLPQVIYNHENKPMLLQYRCYWKDFPKPQCYTDLRNFLQIAECIDKAFPEEIIFNVGELQHIVGDCEQKVPKSEEFDLEFAKAISCWKELIILDLPNLLQAQRGSFIWAKNDKQGMYHIFFQYHDFSEAVLQVAVAPLPSQSDSELTIQPVAHVTAENAVVLVEKDLSLCIGLRGNAIMGNQKFPFFGSVPIGMIQNLEAIQEYLLPSNREDHKDNRSIEQGLEQKHDCRHCGDAFHNTDECPNADNESGEEVSSNQDPSGTQNLMSDIGNDNQVLEGKDIKNNELNDEKSQNSGKSRSSRNSPNKKRGNTVSGDKRPPKINRTNIVPTMPLVSVNEAPQVVEYDPLAINSTIPRIAPTSEQIRQLKADIDAVTIPIISQSLVHMKLDASRALQSENHSSIQLFYNFTRLRKWVVSMQSFSEQRRQNVFQDYTVNFAKIISHSEDNYDEENSAKKL